jgi:hypothetical protein
MLLVPLGTLRGRTEQSEGSDPKQMKTRALPMGVDASSDRLNSVDLIDMNQTEVDSV